MRSIKGVLFAIFLSLWPAQAAEPGYTVAEGKHKGSLYKMAQPRNWNKKLLIIARGARGKGRPLTADFKIEGTYVADLLAGGWLVAQSSYRRNGIFVTDGLADIKALYDLAVSTYGRPERTYIEGSSMGGNIAVLLAEEPRGAFDGALAVGAALTCDDNGTASDKNLDSFRRHTFRPNIPVLFFSNVNELERVAEYAAQASSGTANAVLWTSPRRGHCNVNDDEKLKALSALVDWAESGRKPADGEVSAEAGGQGGRQGTASADPGRR